MRKILLPCALLMGALVYAACGVNDEPPPPADTPMPQETPADPTPVNDQPPVNGDTVQSDIVNNQLEGLEITVGTTVTWTNQDGVPHTVTAGAPGSPAGQFDSGTLQRGQTFSFTFDEPGTFDYFCEVHPMMRATITVTNGEPAAAAAPQPTATPAQTAPAATPFTPALGDDYDYDY